MLYEKIEGYGIYFSGCKNIDILNVKIAELNKGDKINNDLTVKAINHNTKIALFVV